ncbi:hypothetical protein VTJ04DRAFT_4967 [Mycothermus thermophilus]|uniref:uncharacterized protein n=1 Tax=Humicola insolens TaxID=85995 RepID=UPI00374263AC
MTGNLFAAAGLATWWLINLGAVQEQNRSAPHPRRQDQRTVLGPSPVEGLTSSVRNGAPWRMDATCLSDRRDNDKARTELRVWAGLFGFLPPPKLVDVVPAKGRSWRSGCRVCNA